MAVRPYAHDINTDAAKRFMSITPKGIKKIPPTNGSKTQKRKSNKSAHMATTAQFK